MALNKFRFTKPSIAGLTGDGASKAFFWDEGLPGFGLCVRSTGLRTWVVQFRTRDGRSHRITLGDERAVSLDDARRKAREHIGRAKLGADPHAERKAARQAVRFSALVDAYLSDMKKDLRPRSFAEVERHLRKHAAPLHHDAAAGIGRAEVVRLLDAIRDTSGPVAANRVRASLSALWTWALRSGRIAGENPVANTNKPSKEAPRERVLTNAELALIWRCTGSDHDHDRIVRLLLLTGARREEVGSMGWSEIEVAGDGISALWTLPSARSKNKLPHEVPFGPLTVQQLLARREGNPMVFGEGVKGFSGWSRCKERLDSRILKAMTDDFAKAHGRAPADGEVAMAPWVLHDLRRTFSTWANENGVEPHVVEAALNHVSGAAKRGVAGTYNKALYRTQKAAALAAWEAHVRALAGLPAIANNVVALRKAG